MVGIDKEFFILVKLFFTKNCERGSAEKDEKKEKEKGENR